MEHVIPYEGTEPYLFISYAHADADAVMEVAARLQREGYHIWYDAGIVVGSEWPEYIAAHLAGAAAMLAFVSSAYDRSDNCRKEMHFALTKKIPTVNIFLEQFAMRPGLEMQIGSLFALMKFSMPEEQFYQKLLAAPQLAALPADAAAPLPPPAVRPARKRKVRRIVLSCIGLLLLAALVAFGIVGWSTGLIQRLYILHTQTEIPVPDPDTPAVFAEAAFEHSARSWCGKWEGEITVGDLAGLTELEIGGPVETLSDLQWFPNCRSFTLSRGAIESLSTLPPCPLETLRLEDCPISSLEGIGHLTALQELYTVGCPVRKLGDLGRCLELRTLRLEGSDLSSLEAVRPLIRLCEVSVSGCTLSQLRPLLRLSSLSDVCFTDCDLRGRFFYAFDRESALISLELIDCELNSTKNLEDFYRMTTLRLIRTGEKLDWSALAGLPALRTVTADETMKTALAPVLADSGAELILLENTDEMRGDAA